MNTARKFLIIVLAFSVVSLSCSLSSQVQGEPTPTRLAAPARQEGTTNSSGAVTFEDPSTGEDVVVTVLDGGQELQGAEVAYFHGPTNPYEAYLVRDSRGLLAMEFYLHNSEHTLEVTRGEIRPLNPEQVEAAEGYITDMGLVSRNTYLETIPNAELQQRMTELQVACDVMLFFIGTFWEIGRAAKFFLGAIGDAIGIIPQPEDPNIQWDLYESYDAEWGYTTFVFVESQPPLMQSPTVDVGEDGSVTVSLLGIDPTRYPTNSSQFAGMPDQTIFEGPTEFSDLVYFYGVETEDGTILIANEVRQESVCVQDNCTPTEIRLGPLPPGKYYLSYQVRDEVGNFSLPMELGFDIGGSVPAESTSTPVCSLLYWGESTAVGIMEIPSMERQVLLSPFEHTEFGITSVFTPGTWSPSGDMIAYTDYDAIRVMLPTGEGIRTVYSNDTGLRLDPANNLSYLAVSWSPDGESLIWGCNWGRSICAVNADGSNPRVLWSTTDYVDTGNPEWSPDGDHIGFGNTILDLRDGSVVQIEGVRPGGFSFSPDGRRIALTADGYVYTVAVDGSDLVRLTAEPEFSVDSPVWTPDGNWILFLQTEECTSTEPMGCEYLGYGLWSVRTDGSGTIVELENHEAGNFFMLIGNCR